jgi:hypothetical protein
VSLKWRSAVQKLQELLPVATINSSKELFPTGPGSFDLFNPQYFQVINEIFKA